MAEALLCISDVGTFGADKYSDDNWLHVEDGKKRYTDAMLRHFLQEAGGEFLDDESGLPHAAHFAWNALARLQIMINESKAPKLSDLLDRDRLILSANDHPVDVI